MPEIMRMPEESVYWDFKKPALRNKIQLEVANELGVSKENMAEWMFEKSLQMRLVMDTDEHFKDYAEHRDWDGAKEYLKAQIH